MSQPYITFEDVLRRLRLEKGQLNRLIADGHIRVFDVPHCDGRMFRSEDADRLHNELCDRAPTEAKRCANFATKINISNCAGGLM